MAGQNRRDEEWTPSYGRMPRRGVPTPDRQLPDLSNPARQAGETLAGWYQRLNAAAEAERQRRAYGQPMTDTRPTVGESFMGNLEKTGQQLRSIGIPQTIDRIMAPASTPRQQPRAMPAVANIPDSLIRGNPPQQSAPQRTGSIYDRYSDALGDMSRTAGGLVDKFAGGVRNLLPAPTQSRVFGGGQSPSSNQTKSSGSTVPLAGVNPISAIADLYKNYMSPGGKGTFGSGSKSEGEFTDEPDSEEDVPIDEDENSITIGPPSSDPRNVRNAAKMAAARAAGVPATEYGPEIPGGTKIKSATQATQATQSPSTQRTSTQGPATRNQGPILAPLSPGSNQPKLAGPMEARPFQQEPEFVSEYMEPEPYEADPRYPELPDENTEPTTQALDRYLRHLEEMPEQGKPRWWDRVAAGLIGAGEGARSGAGAGFQAGQNYLNAPYNQELARWAAKGKGYEEAAQLEGNSSSNYIKALDSQQRRAESRNRMDNRDINTQYAGRRVATSEQNTQIRAQRALTDEKRLTMQGFRPIILKNGNAGFYNVTTKEVQDTHEPAAEYMRLMETIAQNRTSNNFRFRDQAMQAERIKQGYINIGEAQARYDAENPGLVERR